MFVINDFDMWPSFVLPVDSIVVGENRTFNLYNKSQFVHCFVFHYHSSIFSDISCMINVTREFGWLYYGTGLLFKTASLFQSGTYSVLFGRLRIWYNCGDAPVRRATSFLIKPRGCKLLAGFSFSPISIVTFESPTRQWTTQPYKSSIAAANERPVHPFRGALFSAPVRSQFSA